MFIVAGFEFRQFGLLTWEWWEAQEDVAGIATGRMRTERARGAAWQCLLSTDVKQGGAGPVREKPGILLLPSRSLFLGDQITEDPVAS